MLEEDGDSNDLGEPMSTEEYNQSLLANRQTDTTANQVADSAASQSQSDNVINITPVTSILTGAPSSSKPVIMTSVAMPPGGNTVLNVTPAGLQKLLTMPGAKLTLPPGTLPTSTPPGGQAENRIFSTSSPPATSSGAPLVRTQDMQGRVTYTTGAAGATQKIGNLL